MFVRVTLLSNTVTVIEIITILRVSDCPRQFQAAVLLFVIQTNQ